ncbi:hypothetical protein [Epilithonimonas mollis]|uniref:hypothetical protein n=1 Tax=Epilithonimonas mollis TaxID=216903 RepID=UPI0009334BBE|nr:hypothetical protein [Epilithonimonas mollis]
MWSCEVQRIREYLNRGVTTVDFDKKRPTRTTQDSVSFKTKEMTMVLSLVKAKMIGKQCFMQILFW